MIQRGGEVVLTTLDKVRQTTIQPIIETMVKPGSLIYTDKDDIYARLESWGFRHKSICHSAGEYARDEDGVDSMKCMSIRLKGAGHCYALGSDLIGGFRKRNYRSI